MTLTTTFIRNVCMCICAYTCMSTHMCTCYCHWRAVSKSPQPASECGYNLALHTLKLTLYTVIQPGIVLFPEKTINIEVNNSVLYFFCILHSACHNVYIEFKEINSSNVKKKSSTSHPIFKINCSHSLKCKTEC